MFACARAAIVAAAIALAPGIAAAQDLNLLVMGEDADPDSIERHTPVFNRVVQAISGELRAAGVAVYDETAVTMEFYDLGRVRRADAELISLARSVQRAPIDAVTAFEIRAATVDSPYEGIKDLRLRISGRVIAVGSGLSLADYEVSYRPGDLPMLPLNCHRACLTEFVGDQAARVARDVGAAIALQLAPLTRPATTAAPDPAQSGACGGAAQVFELRFQRFPPEDLARIETYLTVFQGYERHSPVEADAAGTVFRYESCADAERLEKNLRGMFEQTGLEVWIEADDTGFSATKVGGD